MRIRPSLLPSVSPLLASIALSFALLLPAAAPKALAQQTAAPAAAAAQPDAIGLGAKPDAALLQKMMGKRAVPLNQLAISPDGSSLVYVSYGKEGTSLEVVPLRSGGAKKTIAQKDCGLNHPAWSPDGKTIAALLSCDKDGKSDQEQIALITVGDGSVKQIGSLKGDVGDPGWSPDGKLVSFLYVANSTRPSGATAAQRVPEGVIDQQMLTEVQRLATLDAAGTLRFVTPEKLHIYEYDWAADSGSVVFTGAPPPGENNWWVAKLYMESATEANAAPKVILDPSTVTGPLHGLQIAVPRISPDGSQVAFIGGLMSDFGSTGGDIWSVSAQGGQPKNLTEGRKSTPAWIHWESPSSILFTELDQGDVAIHKLDAARGIVDDKTYFKEPETIGDGRARAEHLGRRKRGGRLHPQRL